ncbi:BnaC04g50220D [Brassica napus]|uniref:BnaC04g50220D protein n=1 Tax=Brassica napus TaxID=3708 RepID=A0A078GRZ1_BRANA|nr:BnaC04g50220D [Brassica napus]
MAAPLLAFIFSLLAIASTSRSMLRSSLRES